MRGRTSERPLTGSSVGPPVTSLCHSYIQSPTVFTFTQTHTNVTLWEQPDVRNWYHLCSLRLLAVFSLTRPNLPRLNSFDYKEFVHRPRPSVWKGFKTMLRVCWWPESPTCEVKKKNAHVYHGKMKIAPWWTLFRDLCKSPMQVSSCKCKRMSSHLFEFGFLVPWVNPVMSSVQWLSQYPNTSAFHIELMSGEGWKEGSGWLVFVLKFQWWPFHFLSDPQSPVQTCSCCLSSNRFTVAPM